MYSIHALYFFNVKEDNVIYDIFFSLKEVCFRHNVFNFFLRSCEACVIQVSTSHVTQIILY